MPLVVKIPLSVVRDPNFDALSHDFRLFGGTNFNDGNNVVFPFKGAGEDLFEQSAYMLLHMTPGCVMNGGEFYVNVPASKIAEFVPDTFPDSSWPFENEGDATVQKTWQEYSQSCLKCTDGTYRLWCITYGSKTFAQDGLIDADRKLWHTEFGGLLTKAEGMALDIVPEVSK